MSTILVRRVEGSFCQGQGEDQPAMTGVHGLESQHVSKKGAVRPGVLAVDDHMGARNHWFLLSMPGTPRKLRIREIHLAEPPGVKCGHYHSPAGNRAEPRLRRGVLVGAPSNCGSEDFGGADSGLADGPPLSSPTLIRTKRRTEMLSPSFGLARPVSPRILP